MISAEWLFRNYKLHKAHIRYLNIALGQRGVATHRADVAGAQLARPPLDGTPRAPQQTGTTERMAIRLYEFSGESKEALEQQRLVYLRYLQLYESVCACMTEKEKWLIQHHYIDELSLSALTEMRTSPFFNCAKSTVWRFKMRLLEKADSFLSAVLE